MTNVMTALSFHGDTLEDDKGDVALEKKLVVNPANKNDADVQPMTPLPDLVMQLPPPSETTLLTRDPLRNRVTLVPVRWLKPHENFNHERFLEVLDETRLAGGFRWPIIVDRRTGVILDGHHRHQVSLTLQLEFVPAVLVDYLYDSRISVQRWHPDLEEWTQVRGKSANESLGSCSAKAEVEALELGAIAKDNSSASHTMFQRNITDAGSKSDESGFNASLSYKITTSWVGDVASAPLRTRILFQSPHHGHKAVTSPCQKEALYNAAKLSRSRGFGATVNGNDDTFHCDSFNSRGRGAFGSTRQNIFNSSVNSQPYHHQLHPLRLPSSDLMVMPAGDDDVLIVMDSTQVGSSSQSTLENLTPSKLTGLSSPSTSSLSPEGLLSGELHWETQQLPEEVPVTKEMVLQMGLSGRLYPPKSSRHIMPAELYCFDVFFSLEQLRLHA